MFRLWQAAETCVLELAVSVIGKLTDLKGEADVYIHIAIGESMHNPQSWKSSRSQARTRISSGVQGLSV